MFRHLNRLAAGAVLAHQGQSPCEASPVYNRRQALGAMGGAALALGGATSTGLLSGCTSRKPERSDAFAVTSGQTRPGQIAVIGAGLGGLTTAYRLVRAGAAVSVFEASDRIGGRTWTERNVNADGMFVERGGELVDTGHEELIRLCGELGLEVQELAKVPGQETKEIYYADGRLRAESEIIAAFSPLAAALARDLPSLTVAGEVKTPTFDSQLAKQPAVQRLDRLSLKAYLDSAGIDRWLKQLIGTAYIGEYGLDPEEQSALNLLLLIGADTAAGFKILGSSDESKRIAKGSDAVAHALAASIKKPAPVTFGHQLLAIKDMGGSRLRLTFATPSGSKDHLTDIAVLAIPASLLKAVDFTNLELSPQKRQAIRDWGFGQNAKLMLGFSRRVWHGASIKNGFVLYSDTPSQEFWDTSRGQAGERGLVTNFLGGRGAVVTGPNPAARALADLGRIFPQAAAAHDGLKILQHWPSAPFALGSYTCCRPGHFTSIYGAFGQPELNGRLVFAGEHCSIDDSGFMNGAVRSGQAAARQILSSRLGVKSGAAARG